MLTKSYIKFSFKPLNNLAQIHEQIFTSAAHSKWRRLKKKTQFFSSSKKATITLENEKFIQRYTRTRMATKHCGNNRHQTGIEAIISCFVEVGESTGLLCLRLGLRT